MSEKSGENFGKCPVDVHLSEDAVSRTFASEFLCQEEYGVGVGDPSVGWWSNNWVNTPAMGPGTDTHWDEGEDTGDIDREGGDDQGELDDPFLLIDTIF